MKIHVLTARLWPALCADERACRIDTACEQPTPLDAASWRRETWLGWTAWKAGFDCVPLPAASLGRQAGRGLQAQARRDGCLFLPRVLPPATLRALRKVVLASGHALGLLDGRGLWTGGDTAAMHELPAWLALQQQVALTPELQAVAHHPALLDLLAQVLGAAPLPDQGTVVRLAPPEHHVPATPAHRDGDYIRGRPGLWIAWLPLVACDPLQGVLAVAPGSHRAPAATGWAAAAMRPGDVLLFSADTLHRACPNRQPAHVRLSVDLRFAPAPCLQAQAGSGEAR